MLQAQEQAAWLQDIFRTMEEAEGKEETAFMAGLFGRVGRLPARPSCLMWLHMPLTDLVAFMPVKIKDWLSAV